MWLELIPAIQMDVDLLRDGCGPASRQVLLDSRFDLGLKIKDSELKNQDETH